MYFSDAEFPGAQPAVLSWLCGAVSFHFESFIVNYKSKVIYQNNLKKIYKFLCTRKMLGKIMIKCKKKKKNVTCFVFTTSSEVMYRLISFQSPTKEGDAENLKFELILLFLDVSWYIFNPTSFTFYLLFIMFYHHWYWDPNVTSSSWTTGSGLCHLSDNSFISFEFWQNL